MRCPNCGTHHPPQYEQCVSCGQDFHTEDEALAQAAPSMLSEGMDIEGAASTLPNSSAARAGRREPEHFAVNRGPRSVDFDPDGKVGQGKRKADKPKRRSQNVKTEIRSGSPLTGLIMVAAVILLVVAGASIFFLTKPPEEEVLLQKGQKELDIGQYAFAVDTLTKASHIGKGNPKVLMALARAYIGVDQVDKAWECISRAKQMGNGAAEDPQLASQLANYYRMHNRFDKAVELLRPLAQVNVPGKKAELADLDALWGDEQLREGKLESAQTLWEEVKSMGEGSRFTEADNRLATIYQRIAGKLIDSKKDTEALGYLNKLNAIAENPRNYETCADIYERTGQLELAIDQLRKAQRLAAHDEGLTHKLSALLTKRGKELLDKGELDTGYGYLQQARSVDPSSSVATVTLKGVTVDMQGGLPHISGQVWNPTDLPINALVLKTDLVDVQDEHVIWTKETKVVDEYVPPLAPHEGKHIDITSGASAKMDGSAEFKIYFDGKLYNSYLLGKKDKAQTAKTDGTVAGDSQKAAKSDSLPPPAPPHPASAPVPGATPQGQGQSSEEKTMKDLGF